MSNQADDAGSAIMAAVQRLRPSLRAFDDDAAKELGRIVGAELAKAGATEEEARDYGKQVFLSVMLT